MEPLDRSGTGGTNRRYGFPFSPSNIIQAPLVALLEYSGILRVRPIQRQEPDPQSNNPVRMGPDSSSPEVSIRIVGSGDQDGLLRDHASGDSIEVGLNGGGGGGGGVSEAEAGGETLTGLNSPVGSSGSSSIGSDVEGQGSATANGTGDRTWLQGNLLYQEQHQQKRLGRKRKSQALLELGEGSNATSNGEITPTEPVKKKGRGPGLIRKSTNVVEDRPIIWPISSYEWQEVSKQNHDNRTTSGLTVSHYAGCASAHQHFGKLKNLKNGEDPTMRELYIHLHCRRDNGKSPIETQLEAATPVRSGLAEITDDNGVMDPNTEEIPRVIEELDVNSLQFPNTRIKAVYVSCTMYINLLNLNT
ncbi:RING/U-box superfamily protein [Carex littledalei]|uniref:RING/U-box superfamily protein n=1 Tax=Carex littledalei TaxID=544730 RepID=A0A833RNC7_9POAL|nr:RING/U-box superfamily protein [Carex littledalei]